MYKLKVLLVIHIFTSISFFSCVENQTINTGLRANPTPPNIDIEEKLKEIEDAKSTPTPRPFPVITPVPEPTIELDKFEFDLTISFNTRLPRVKINDGSVESLPLKKKILGGKHKIEIFDLASGCYDGKEYIIDKDTFINLDADKICNF